MKKSRYEYTEGQIEINRALKMQEKELVDLKEQTEKLTHDIEDSLKVSQDIKTDLDEISKNIEALQQKALNLAKKLEIEPTILSTSIDKTSSFIPEEPFESDKLIPQEDIPSWEEIMQKANRRVPEEVVLEDLLSESEFQYCIEDVNRIDKEFATKTKLNKTDIAFLLIATALQTARWILIQMLMGELGDTIDKSERVPADEGDKTKKKDTDRFNRSQNDREHTTSEKGYPTWKEILFGQYPRIDGGKTRWRCPYDAQENAPAGFDDGNKGNHRVHTLGHDPNLGWIFGTANLMTCSISLSKKFGFSTYRVQYPGGCFAERLFMLQMFGEVFDSIREDKFRLPAALFTQAVHLKSDVFTKRGLPVPLLEVFSKELAGKLYSEQYDSLCLLKDLKTAGAQAGFSILINMLVTLIHGLFYNQAKDGKREHYEVRTRKILLYSNAIASSINLAYVGINASTGNIGEALKKLDLGGLLVTIYRLFTDTRFITKIKDQFILEELDKITQKELNQLEAMFEH